MKDLVDKYISKMKLIYQCDIEIHIVNNKVILKKVKNYRENRFIVPNFINTIGRMVFEYKDEIEEIIVGDSTECIDSEAFYGCSSLRKIDIKNVTKIGERAFYYCNRLKNIKLEKVEYLGDYAFSHCTKLEEIRLEKIIDTGNYTFEDCYNLKSVRLNNIKHINNGLFSYCSKLDKIECKGLKSVGKYALEDCSINGDIVEKLEYIGEGAFGKCNDIESIKINKCVRIIPENAFSSCRMLKHVEIREGVEEIEKFAFFDCIRLYDVKLPSRIKIHKKAFNSSIDIEKEFSKEYNIEYSGDYMNFSRKYRKRVI